MIVLDRPIGALHEPLTGRRLTSAECGRRIRERAALFQRAGMAAQDRVFIHYGNRAEFFIDVVAVWLVGGCVVPLDPRFSAFEVESLAKAARPRFSIWDRDPDADVAGRLRALNIVVLGISERASDEESFQSGRDGLRLDDPALILFTSGTTGAAKGAVHTHRSLRARWISQRERFGTAAFAHTLCLQPTNFSWGLVGTSLFAWLSGQDLYVVPAFRSDILLRLGAMCDEHAITCVPSVPAMWRIVLRTTTPPKQGTLRRVLCCTGPLPASLWRDVQRWSGVRDVINVYGMTESGSLAACSSADCEPEDGLAGVPLGSIIRILPSGTTVNDLLTANECDTSTAGHIWVQTPGLMRGYFEREDLTSQVVSNGWFQTGDIGNVDERGRLYLRGRDKEMINVGGTKVYPADVDAVIATCDAVADACTFAAADALNGEQVAIAITLHHADLRGMSAVYRWAATRLADYQIPRRWYLVSTIPRNARGKVNRADAARLCEKLAPVDQALLDQP